MKDKESATGLKAMRQAAKNILYTVVNSRAYDAENVNSGLMNWQIAAIVIDASYLYLLSIIFRISSTFFNSILKSSKL